MIYSNWLSFIYFWKLLARHIQFLSIDLAVPLCWYTDTRALRYAILIEIDRRYDVWSRVQ